VILAFFLGLIECFYGFRLFRPTLFLVGFIAGTVLVVFFLFSIWTGANTQDYKGWVILIFAIFVGISVGFLIMSMSRIGLMVTGGVLGFFASLTLHALLLYKINAIP
jgi:hypothetical protein